MKQTIFLLSILFSFLGMNASEGSSVPAQKQTNLQNKIQPTRPRMPSNVQIGCSYGNGILEFQFPESIDSVSIDILQDEEVVWSGWASQEVNVVYIPEFSGDYIIECTATDGRVFQGELYF